MYFIFFKVLFFLNINDIILLRLKHLEVNEMETFAVRLKKLLKEKKISQSELSKRTHIGKSSISTYLKGGYIPKQDKIYLIAKVLDVSESYLMGWTDEKERKQTPPPSFNLSDIKPIVKTVQIPLIGVICAGNGIYADENLERMLVVDSNTITADYALTVRGDSMIDENILNGDIAFFEKTFNFESGKIYACIVNGENTGAIKKVHQQGSKIILESANKDYTPQIYDIDDVHIVGKYKGLLRTE